MKKLKVNSTALEFQPDAIATALRPLPLFARMGVWIGLIFFLTALLFSVFCKVDIIVNAPAKIISEAPNIVMKPLDRTVIKSINIRVGEFVKKGQILLQFDPAINQAEEERLTNDLVSLQAQYNRWSAEFDDKKYQINNSATQDEKWQLAIYNQRKSFYDEKLRYYDGSINRINANISSVKSTVETQNLRFQAIDEISKMYEKLHESNAAPKRELLEIQMQRMQLEADIAKLKNSIQELSHEKESTIASKQTFIMEWKKDISEQLVQVERSLNTTQKSLDKVLQLNQYITLHSPCDAIVHEIANFPVGSAVREAEALITLVPINNLMELEAEIPSKDIGQVKVGDKVRVKLNAFPFQRFGTLNGVVRNISENTFQKQSNNNQDNPIYYRGIITLSGELKNSPSNFRLIPGMEAQAEIKVGTRRVIEYIVYPLIKSLDEAIREP